MSSLDTNKSLIENSDYLKKLALELKKVSNVSEIDNNLLYEVAYASTYLDILLSKSSTNKLSEDLEEVKEVLEGVLSTASSSDVLSVKSSLDYRNLLKCRYNKVSDASYERSYEVISEEGAISHYIRKCLPNFILMLVFAIIVLNGGIVNILPKITSFSCDLFDLPDMTTAGALQNSQFNPLINMLFSFVCMLLFFTLSLTSILDLLYLCFPFLRDLLENNGIKYVSSRAIDSVMQESDGRYVRYEKVKDYNRIERNKVWLDKMLESTSDTDLWRGTRENNVNVLDIYEVSALRDTLVKLKEEIDLEAKCTKGKYSKKYYLLMARIEFLHDEYLSLLEKV